MTFSGTLYEEDPIQLVITPTNCTFKNVGLNTEIEYNSEYTSSEDNLDALNSKFEQLQVKATASSGVKLNVAIDGAGADYSFNSILTVSNVTASTNTSIQLQQEEYVDIDPIVFSGTLYAEDPITVTVTPTNCKIKNFATNPETEHETAHTFNNVTDLSTINAECLNLQVCATASSDTKITVAIDGEETEFDFGATPAVSDISVQTLNTTASLEVDKYIDVPIVFTGTIYDSDPVSISVTPTNCKFKGLNSNASTEHSSEYTYQATSLSALNTEFANMQICATDISEVKVNVAIDDSGTDYNFANVVAISNVTASLDTTTQLQQDVYKEIESIVFSGKVYESDPVTVTVTPTNCKFKGLASGAETEHSDAYVFSSKTSLEQLNTEFASLQVCATAISGVKLAVSIDGSSTDYNFANVVAISDVEVSSFNNSESLTVGQYISVPITFSGTIYSSDPVSISVTPTNCAINGFASDGESHSDAYTYQASSLESLNAEFANMKICANDVTGVNINIAIDGSGTDYAFNDVTAISNASVQTLDITTALNTKDYTAVPIVFSGSIYESDPVSVTVTPTNCYVKGYNSEPTPSDEDQPHTFQATSLSALNAEFANMKICAGGISGVKLAVSIDGSSTDYSFANVTAVSYIVFDSSLTNSTQLKTNHYIEVITEDNPFNVTGMVYDTDPVSVTITPINCSFKGLASAPDTEHSSAYTIENKTSIEAINTELASLSVKPNEAGTAVTLRFSSDDADFSPKTVTFNGVINGSSITFNEWSGETAQLSSTAYTPVTGIQISGNLYLSDPVRINLVPTNCKVKIADTPHEGTATITNCTNLSVVNSQLSQLQLQATAASGISLACSVIEYPEMARTYTNFAIAQSSLDINGLTWEMGSVHIGAGYLLDPLVFTGTVEPLSPVTVTITPNDCSITGFASDSETSYSEPYQFTATSLEQLNAEFANLNVLCEHMTASITVASGSDSKTFEMEVTPASSITSVTCAGSTNALTTGTYGSIGAIAFAGNVNGNDPVIVTVTPANCSFKGCASGADTEHSTAYEFTATTSLEQLNTEFAAIEVNCSATTGAQLTVNVEYGEGTVSNDTVISFTSVTEPTTEPAGPEA